MADSLLQSATLQPGQRLGRCQIVRKIGQGGMGEVYVAEHVGLQKKVAVKVLPRDSNEHRQIDRFLHEARMASRIEHPNVITIHDVGWDGGVHYIVMRYVEGRNLAEVLRLNGGPLPWPTAMRVIRGAAKGLSAVHRQGLIHRDIKPANIMLTNDGDVLLMDFGLVRSEESADFTRLGTVVGTLRYMSPEQCRGEPLDRKSDIFSLGGTLYTLLTGAYPYPGAASEVCDALRHGSRPPRPRSIMTALPQEVEDLVHRAMAPRAKDRYRDADEMARAIGALIRTAPKDVGLGAESETTGMISEQLPELELVVDTADQPPDEEAGSLRNWQIAGGIVVILLILGLVINLSLGGPSRTQMSNDVPTGEERDEMVLIPAGQVQLGTNEAAIRSQLAKHDLSSELLESLIKNALEEPHQKVYVPAFQIDAYEVTNEQYAQFLAAANKRDPPRHWNGRQPPADSRNKPVVGIRQSDAMAYAAWAGKQLPTRNQWLRAFRGDTDFFYPWGNEFRSDLANFAENRSIQGLANVRNTPDDKSPFGVYNLCGNACEILRDTMIHTGDQCALVKGAGALAPGYARGMAPSTLYLELSSTHLSMGFRCVKEIP